MSLADRLFPDGYCECRCGPAHHKVSLDEAADAVDLLCTYHRRVCAQMPARELSALGAHVACQQLEPMVGTDRAMRMASILVSRRRAG
jgi:hypothetical protein